jgi:hypothetical protein
MKTLNKNMKTIKLSKIETWYEFTAYNTPTLYGYGNQEEAEKYCDFLNKGREINMYGYSVAEGTNSDYCDHWGNIEDSLTED